MSDNNVLELKPLWIYCHVLKLECRHRLHQRLSSAWSAINISLMTHSQQQKKKHKRSKYWVQLWGIVRRQLYFSPHALMVHIRSAKLQFPSHLTSLCVSLWKMKVGIWKWKENVNWKTTLERLRRRTVLMFIPMGRIPFRCPDCHYFFSYCAAPAEPVR